MPPIEFPTNCPICQAPLFSELFFAKIYKCSKEQHYIKYFEYNYKSSMCRETASYHHNNIKYLIVNTLKLNDNYEIYSKSCSVKQVTDHLTSTLFEFEGEFPICNNIEFPNKIQIYQLFS